MEEESRKKLANTAVAAAAVTGVLVGGLFSSPGDLVRDPESTAVDRTAPPPAIEIIAEEPEENTGSGGSGELPEGGSSGEKKKDPSPSGGGNSGSGSGAGEKPEPGSASLGPVRSALRSAILKLPVWLRALFGVPLWCVGWLLITSASALWSAVLSPVLGAASGWLLAGGLILLTSAATVKAVFPDLPLKKILNKRTLLTVLVGIMLLALIDTVMPFFWDRYEKIALLVKILGSSAVLALVLFPFFRRVRKKRKASKRLEITEG